MILSRERGRGRREASSHPVSPLLGDNGTHYVLKPAPTRESQPGEDSGA